MTDILHGVPVTDPYRWLENQDSPETRAWIAEQQAFAQSYFESLPGRDRIRERVRQLLAVETHDHPLRMGNRYFYRKRSPEQEQGCIYFREGPDGQERLLIDPAKRGKGKYTAVIPRQVSPDGRLLMYEVKQGGERTGTFEIVEVETLRVLADALPRGYLRSFAFAPDNLGFLYSHEVPQTPSKKRAVYYHWLGQSIHLDRELFAVSSDGDVRLHFVCGDKRIGFLVFYFKDRIYTNFYLGSLHERSEPHPILVQASYLFSPFLVGDRVFALTDLNAKNCRIVEVHPGENQRPTFVDLVPESESPIRSPLITKNHFVLSYPGSQGMRVRVYDLKGSLVNTLPIQDGETVSVLNASQDSDEVLLASESFTQPVRLYRYDSRTNALGLWIDSNVAFDAAGYQHRKMHYPSVDGTRIPMFLFGRTDTFAEKPRPTVMTSYGGFGLSMSPRFSVLVAFLVEHGCLFALPNIRGGSVLGALWHESAKRRNRITAYNDFIAAAEWLVRTGQSECCTLAIFGGSNAGLLVGAAMTRRPDLFGAVLCIAPLLDMLRYHFFDGAHVWKDEYGTADDAEDFSVLAAYSPYHHVRQGGEYPATMIVSGDADRNCNPLHARKMTARLQAANASSHPMILDYSPFRGHSPVLPLSERVEALTNRLSFLSEQLRLSV